MKATVLFVTLACFLVGCMKMTPVGVGERDKGLLSVQSGDRIEVNLKTGVLLDLTVTSVSAHRVTGQDSTGRVHSFSVDEILVIKKSKVDGFATVVGVVGGGLLAVGAVVLLSFAWIVYELE